MFGLLGFGVGHSGRFLAAAGLDRGLCVARCCRPFLAVAATTPAPPAFPPATFAAFLLLLIGGFSHLNKLITDLGGLFLFLERLFFDDVILLDVLFDDGSRSCTLGGDGAGLFRRVHHLALFDQERLLRAHAGVRGDGDRDLETLLSERSRTYYANDVDYPGAWEPGGEDFFSAALMEADLMRRVMPPREFASWFHRFLPEVTKGGPKALLQPAIVTDRSDPKLVHLDGLNLSRAWCMRSIAAALPSNDPARKVLTSAADQHATAALAHVASGDYAGEHWLASFAVFLLSNEQ